MWQPLAIKTATNRHTLELMRRPYHELWPERSLETQTRISTLPQ